MLAIGDMQTFGSQMHHKLFDLYIVDCGGVQSLPHAIIHSPLHGFARVTTSWVRMYSFAAVLIQIFDSETDENLPYIFTYIPY